MKETFRGYGEVAAGPGVKRSRADRILGSRVELDSQRRPDQVAIQWLTTEGPAELQMDFVQAMFLLSTLKSMQLDTGVPFPDDPRADKNSPLC